MRKSSLFYQLISKVSLPAYSAGVGAGLSLCVAVLTVSTALAYKTLIQGIAISEFDWELVSVATITASLTGAGIGFVTGTRLRGSIEKLTLEMEAAMAGKARTPSMLASAELRQFRTRSLRRVGQLRRSNQNLERTAYVDSRTGLGNAAALEREMNITMARTSFEKPGALLLLSLDKIGRVVEHHGIVVAQQILRLAGERIEREIAAISGAPKTALQGAVLVSLHRGMYALWLPDAKSRELVASIARSIRMTFVAPFEIDGQSISVGVSGGIAMAPEEGDSRSKLLVNADLAVRQVRKENATGFRFFTPRLTRIARGRHQLEAELREAVANREFKPVFQPKIDFATGRVVGAEALARWQRANGKIISPAAFIPLAEEIGLIDQIGNQILESACLSARAWLREGHEVSIAVNVSPLQFQSGNLAKDVCDILQRTHLPPSRLELEITESMAVSDPEHVAKVLKPLREMGMKLSIDDFGTGHSNLAMLSQLPFDVFKIDRQFISALDKDENAPAIVEMILALANTLGLQTVAEGIETPRQAEFLRTRNCTMAQGYLYSPGLPHYEFLDLLRTWRANPVPRANDNARQTG